MEASFALHTSYVMGGVRREKRRSRPLRIPRNIPRPYVYSSSVDLSIPSPPPCLSTGIGREAWISWDGRAKNEGDGGVDSGGLPGVAKRHKLYIAT